MSGAAFARGAGIAVGLAQRPVATRHGQAWAYSPDEDVIMLALADGAGFTDFEKALSAHEAAHLRITRYNRFTRMKGLTLPQSANLMNALEDPRVQAWAVATFPGAIGWFEAMWRKERSGPTPNLTDSLFLQFLTTASIADAFAWRVPLHWPLHPRTRAALEATAGARRRYATVELPDAALARRVEREGGVPVALAGVVAPVLSRDGLAASWPTSRAEALVQISAARAWRLARDEILPEATLLIEDDIGRIADMAERDHEFRERLNFLLRTDQPVTSLVERALAGAPAARDDEDTDLSLPSFLRRQSAASMPSGAASLRALAREAFDRFLAALRPGNGLSARGGAAEGRVRFGAGPPSESSGGEDDEESLPGSPDADTIALRALVAETLRSQLAPLARRLEDAFHRAPRLRPSAGHASGVRPDLKAAMRFDADRRGYDRLWIRNIRVEDERRAAVLILVDLSGSMAGAEIQAAIQGATLLAAALTRLGPGIEFCVQGFQDVLTPPFKTFEEPAGPAVLRRFEEMAMEVVGNRPGGNNMPSHNDDGPCLLEAAGILARHPCPERLLVVVSDGQPAGRRSNAADLRSAIVDVRNCGIRLVGLGLGDDTAHVADFYAPDFVSRIPPKDFARKIGDVVVGALRKG